MRFLILLLPVLCGCLLSETASSCDYDEKSHTCRQLQALGRDAGIEPRAPQDAGKTQRRAGQACDCDTDCEDKDWREGICVAGVCMTRPAGDCDTNACAYPDYCVNFEETGPTCVPKCDGQCEGVCSQDGYCVPGQDTSCRSSCSAYCN